MDCYYLDEFHTPVRVNLDDWMARNPYDETTRRVGHTEKDGIRVSTVFLGFDHRFDEDGPPILFETMIFGGEHDQWQERCCTWKEAVAMHKQACDLVWPPAAGDESSK